MNKVNRYTVLKAYQQMGMDKMIRQELMARILCSHANKQILEIRWGIDSFLKVDDDKLESLYEALKTEQTLSTEEILNQLTSQQRTIT